MMPNLFFVHFNSARFTLSESFQRDCPAWVLRDRGPFDFLLLDCMRETVDEANHNTSEELEDRIRAMIRAIRSQMAMSLHRGGGGDLRRVPRGAGNTWTEMILKLQQDFICNQRE
jgi:hypothetical protein